MRVNSGLKAPRAILGFGRPESLLLDEKRLNPDPSKAV